MSLFPIFLKLTGRRCLVVGAGNIAESKIHSLLDAEADVTVVSIEAFQSIHDLAAEGSLKLHLRPFTESDVDGSFLVVSGTNVPEVNRAVFAEAQRQNILVNAVDDPPYCDYYFPSIVQRGRLADCHFHRRRKPGACPASPQRAERAAAAGPWSVAVGAWPPSPRGDRHGAAWATPARCCCTRWLHARCAVRRHAPRVKWHVRMRGSGIPNAIPRSPDRRAHCPAPPHGLEPSLSREPSILWVRAPATRSC